MSSPIIGGGLTTAPPQAVPSYVLSDLLTHAYRLAGALKQPGMGLAPSEQTEALNLVNFMIDGWKIENLMIVQYIRTVQSIQTLKQTYSVGPGQDWDIERPEKIHAAGFVLQPGLQTEAELPMQIILSYEQWAAFVAKNVQSSIPLTLYYQATLPFGTATLWPIPNADTTQVAIYTQSTLEQFLTINDQVYMPMGYQEGLVYNLALRVHQMYPGRPIDPTVAPMATFYKERIKYQQLIPLGIESDPAVLDRKGQYYGGYPKAWVPYGP